MKPLAIIPTYVRNPVDVDMLDTTLRTLRETAGDGCDVTVIDDGSPDASLVRVIGEVCRTHDTELIAKPDNEGFARTVNVGLRRALEEQRDAVLINSDIEFGLAKNWLGVMCRQTCGDSSELASVIGALLVYPNGLIQHAGIYFSLLTRDFSEALKFGPMNLPEAQHAKVTPVTGALQLIRHECLEHVGLYDESFRLGWEDVDYCVRVWLSGRQCVYQPAARAIHHESFFRGRPDDKIAQWTEESWRRFCAKYADVSFAEFVPTGLTQ